MGLAELIAETRRKERVPADVKLGGGSNTGLVLGVLEHLARYWSDVPPSRSFRASQSHHAPHSGAELQRVAQRD